MTAEGELLELMAPGRGGAAVSDAALAAGRPTYNCDGLALLLQHQVV